MHLIPIKNGFIKFCVSLKGRGGNDESIFVAICNIHERSAK